MSRTLTPQTQLDTLRKDAKRWLKAIRAGDPAALGRFRASYPRGPDAPALRDVQHALACEYGCESWVALRAALDDMALARRSRSDRLDQLLRHGWDGDVDLARRILRRDPELARESLHAAATCGDLAEVERRLQADPESADKPGGPFGWTPLACVAFGRLDGDNALAIARLLLAAGADPDFRFDDGWENPFTALTGTIGLGEGAKPSHPQARELAELLIAAGASPYDTQALYNASIVGADLEWYDFLWRHSQAHGVADEWRAPTYFRMKDGRRLAMVDYLLGNAVGQNHLARAEWLLDRGADPAGLHGYTFQPLLALARLSGFVDMAALLERRGAPPVALAGAEAFRAACLGGDEAAARRLAAADPALARQPGPLLAAAEFGNARAVALLLALGAPAGAADHEGITALHRAVQSGSLATVELLLAAGADVDARERHWRGTPLSWALVLGKPDIARRLAPISHDVRALAGMAELDRLEVVLGEMPARADEVLAGDTAPTPLFCLPNDEDAALAVARILLRFGADPRRKDAEGRTAIDAARGHGLEEAADLMAEWPGGS